jgi:hypothetical protein
MGADTKKLFIVEFYKQEGNLHVISCRKLATFCPYVGFIMHKIRNKMIYPKNKSMQICISFARFSSSPVTLHNTNSKLSRYTYNVILGITGGEMLISLGIFFIANTLHSTERTRFLRI